MAGGLTETRRKTMLRLLGILTLGHLIFGGRHHRFRRGILFGALLGYLANKNFDAGRVAEDVREKAEKAKKAARKAMKAAEKEIRRAEYDHRVHEIRERADARRAAREDRLNALHAEIEAKKAARKAEARRKEVYALPVSGLNEAKVIQELAEDLEKNSCAAAMAANVPTIDFPEDDEKYFSSRKYSCAH